METTLKEACSQAYPESAICVQRFDDSLNSAIRITYRISLRSSSLREPRYPLLRVVFFIIITLPGNIIQSSNINSINTYIKFEYIPRIMYYVLLKTVNRIDSTRTHASYMKQQKSIIIANSRRVHLFRRLLTDTRN